MVLRPSFNKPISTQNKDRTLFAVFKFAVFWRKTTCQCLRSLLTNSDGHPSPSYPARLSSISACDVLSSVYALPMFETPPEKISFFLPYLLSFFGMHNVFAQFATFTFITIGR